MPFGENLRWLLAYRHSTPKELANVCEVKQNSISNYANGVSTPSYEILNKIIKFLDVTADEILYADLPANGLSDKIRPSTEIAPNVAPNIAPNDKKEGKIELLHQPKIVTVNQHGKENILLVPVKAAAGYLNGYGDPEYIETLPGYQIPGFEHGTYRMFEVNGHSMMPTLKNRDKIIGKWCHLEDIRDNFLHILITKVDGVVVKRVLNRIKKDGILILKSDGNRYEFPDMIIDPNDVMECWTGVAKFTKDLSGPNDLYSRLDDAEGRLAMIENLLKGK